MVISGCIIPDRRTPDIRGDAVVKYPGQPQSGRPQPFYFRPFTTFLGTCKTVPCLIPFGMTS